MWNLEGYKKVSLHMCIYILTNGSLQVSATDPSRRVVDPAAQGRVTKYGQEWING